MNKIISQFLLNREANKELGLLLSKDVTWKHALEHRSLCRGQRPHYSNKQGDQVYPPVHEVKVTMNKDADYYEAINALMEQRDEIVQRERRMSLLVELDDTNPKLYVASTPIEVESLGDSLVISERVSAIWATEPLEWKTE